MRSLGSLILAGALICGAAACGGDSTASDGGGGIDAAISDSGVDPVTRGQYLVDHVSLCGDCHTPRNKDGSPDLTRYLAGAECFLDVDPAPGMGCLHSRNLTNHATGLASLQDAEIKRMFVEGLRPDDSVLVPVMPYWVFYNMSTFDADAIVAYLRTVAGVDHLVPPNEAPFDAQISVALPINRFNIPPAPQGDMDAENGRYLATMAGLCIECHTEELMAVGEPPINMAKVFQGGRVFPAALLGLPSPPFPENIVSENITPHATGIAGRTVADIVAELKQGVDPMDNLICPPMPVGPMGGYGGLTDQDATDIATYILGLQPGDNDVAADCSIPPP